MAQAFTPGLQLKETTYIKRRRELPVPGHILVKAGDLVKSQDIVAQAFLPGELHIIRLSEKMGLEPFEVIKGLCIKEGDAVKPGYLICEHSGLFGLFKSRFTSPVEGVVELINQRTGHVGIRSEARPVSINAYISGRVLEVEDNKSVLIETQATFAQGIFGVGGERHGRIRLLDVEAQKTLSPADIPDDIKGEILIGGTRPSLETINKAASLGAVGLVCGSIDDRALAGYLGYDLGIALTGDEEIPMTIIVTEGFGLLPISERILSLFTAHKCSLASINGATQVRAGALRPEIIISLSTEACGINKQPGTEENNERESGLHLGSKIRIIRVPYFGQRATVTALPQAMQTIETGACARVLEAKLENGQRVIVPRANVELI